MNILQDSQAVELCVTDQLNVVHLLLVLDSFDHRVQILLEIV